MPEIRFSAIYPGIVTSPEPTGKFLGRSSSTWGAGGGAPVPVSAPGCRTGTTPIRSPSGGRPEARIVYVPRTRWCLPCPGAADQQPGVATTFVQADMIDPVQGPLAESGNLLDFTQPVALTFMGVLGHIVD